MTATPVEWVLVVLYGTTAFRATYGRLSDTRYTKDYIQLSQNKKLFSDLQGMFPPTSGKTSPLTYRWPIGMAPGALDFKSVDRPHLKWETRLGVPAPWRMAPSPSEVGPETIPGNPNHTDGNQADAEFASIKGKGAGQPYLVAVKLSGEANTLHLRAYLSNPSKSYSWADASLLPKEVQDLLAKTSSSRATAWSKFEGGLYFDFAKNHDAWQPPSKTISKFKAAATIAVDDDIAAEGLDVSPSEVAAFKLQIDSNSFSVDDTFSSSKTRGSAQRAFADRVKANYKFCCAVTGISTKEFLVAAHIVPWSEDKNIRLDPSNGICLSLIMDKAFENGYLLVEDDFTITIDWTRVGGDKTLGALLGPYDGKKINVPKANPPKVNYLKRRRARVKSKK